MELACPQGTWAALHPLPSPWLGSLRKAPLNVTHLLMRCVGTRDSTLDCSAQHGCLSLLEIEKEIRKTFFQAVSFRLSKPYRNWTSIHGNVVQTICLMAVVLSASRYNIHNRLGVRQSLSRISETLCFMQSLNIASAQLLGVWPTG